MKMLEVLEKIILAGAGLASMTKEKAEQLVEMLIDKGQLSAKDKNAMVNRLLKSTKSFDKNMEKKIKNISLAVVKSSQQQIESLNKKLDKLARELAAEKKQKKTK